MTLIMNAKLEDLLEVIGDHEQKTIVMEFPDGISKTKEEVKNNEKLHNWQGYQFDTGVDEGVFPGSNWAALMNSWIGEIYGSLISSQEHIVLTPIGCTFDYSKGDFPFRIEFGRYIGEALLNALRHGNKFDAHKKITIDMFCGSEGIVWSVLDEGNGFDVKDISKKCEMQDENWHSKESTGIGFVCWLKELPIVGFMPGQKHNYVFSYNEKGNQWMFLYEFAKNRYKPIKNNSNT